MKFMLRAWPRSLSLGCRTSAAAAALLSPPLIAPRPADASRARRKLPCTRTSRSRGSRLPLAASFAFAGRAATERVMSGASLVFGLKEIVAIIGTCALAAFLDGEDEFDTTLALYQTSSLCREVMLSVLIEPFRRPVDKLHLRVYRLYERPAGLIAC